MKIVFIHGMFVTNRCWDEWVRHLSNRGFSCEAPPWPLKESSPDQLRARHPDIEGEGKVRLKGVVSFFEKYVSDMGKDVVLIGHSMGGLIVQILLSRGLGLAGVAIDSAPPRGVIATKFSFLKSNWPLLNPLPSLTTPVLLTKSQFQYAFANYLTGDRLDKAYSAVVPQSKLVGIGALTAAGRVDFSLKKAPLLFIAGEDDNIIPASLNRSNYRRYSKNKSRTDFVQFPRRTHYLINDEGWQEIADHVVRWLNGL